MKKILNWTFGACFRTIGRFLAVIIVCVLLIFIGSKLGFKLDSILPIKVNAQTLTNWAEGLPTLNRVQMYECQTSNKCYDKEVNVQGLVTLNGNRDIAISQSLTLDNGGISIQTNVNELKPGYLYLTNYYVCANYSLNDVDALIYNSNYGTPGIANTTYNSTSIATLSNIPGSGEQEFTSCKLYSGLYVPNVANNWATLRLKKSKSQSGTFISLIAVENRELGIYSDTIKSIVENSNGNVKEAVDRVAEETKKTNDTITNNDISGANDSATGFFDNFQDNDYGLSSIITAPLRAINAMLNDTCVAPGATYKGKSFSLPCGSMLWSREGGQDFRNFLNIFYGGFLVYFVIRSLFLDIEKLKNPNNDKVEVEKL